MVRDIQYVWSVTIYGNKKRDGGRQKRAGEQVRQCVHKSWLYEDVSVCVHVLCLCAFACVRMCVYVYASRREGRDSSDDGSKETQLPDLLALRTLFLHSPLILGKLSVKLFDECFAQTRGHL